MSATALFILGTILLVAGYDLFTISARGMDSSISRLLRGWGTTWPLFAYLFAFTLGCLFGHFFL
jgi:hypothetical protein